MTEEKAAGFSLTVGKEQVQEALRGVLCEALTPEKRDELVQTAVRKLLEGNWQTPSDVQRIFRGAAGDVAREVAQQEFAKPENEERIRALVQDAMRKMFEGKNRDNLIEKIVSTMERAIGY